MSTKEDQEAEARAEAIAERLANAKPEDLREGVPVEIVNSIGADLKDVLSANRALQK